MTKSFLTQGFSRVTSNGNYSRSRRLFGSVLCIWKTQFAPHSSPEWIHSRGSLRLIANLKAFHWDMERRKQSAPAFCLHEWDNAAQGQGGSDLRPVTAGPALKWAANGSRRCRETLKVHEASDAAALTLLEAELRWGWNQPTEAPADPL